MGVGLVLRERGLAIPSKQIRKREDDSLPMNDLCIPFMGCIIHETGGHFMAVITEQLLPWGFKYQKDNIIPMQICTRDPFELVAL